MQCAGGLSSHASSVESFVDTMMDTNWRHPSGAVFFFSFFFFFFFSQFSLLLFCMSKFVAVGHNIVGLFSFFMALHSKTRESCLAV